MNRVLGRLDYPVKLLIGKHPYICLKSYWSSGPV